MPMSTFYHPATPHIGLVQRCCTYHKGGAERYGLSLYFGLQQLGYRVTMVTAKLDSELVDRVDAVTVPVLTASSSSAIRSFAERAGVACREQGFDCVIGLGQTPVADIVRVTGRVHAHWLPQRFGPLAFPLLSRLHPRYREILRVERETFGDRSAAQQLIVQSELERRLLTTHFGIASERMTTIYNGVDPQRYHPCSDSQRAAWKAELGLTADTKVVCFAAAHDFVHKGLETCLRAMQHSRSSAYTLVVVGDGPIRKFRRLSEQLGVGQRVLFVGRKGNLQASLAASDLFVLPTRYEPFPNVVLEAMACGTPPITTRTCGVAEVIDAGDTGYLLDHFADSEALAGIIDSHLAASADSRREMSARCRSAALQRTVERNVEQVAELIHRTVSVRKVA